MLIQYPTPRKILHRLKLLPWKVVFVPVQHGLRGGGDKLDEDSSLQAPVTQRFSFTRKMGSHVANRMLCPVAP